MKCTLLLTQECNLRCEYCYITKRHATMDIANAQKIIDFIFNHAQAQEDIHIGFFGGEPLLEFNLLTRITNMIINHAKYPEHKVEISLVTNGTLINDDIIDYIYTHNIGLGISCDGTPQIQDMNRRYSDGRISSPIVESNIRAACGLFKKELIVNSVYTPSTFRQLATTVDYFYNLGVRQIYLNIDYSGQWTQDDATDLIKVYRDIGELFISYYKNNDPAVISFIDNKIAVILGNGYKEENRCHMGKKEFAFSPDGNIFPCERLIEDGNNNSHCIGNIETGIDYSRLINSCHMNEATNNECRTCSLKDYCMNWCGCSNYMASTYYNQVSPFLCASERAAIETAYNVINELEKEYGSHLIPTLASMNHL